MPNLTRSLRSLGFVLIALLGGMLGSFLVRPQAPSASPVNPEYNLVATFGVGGVVTNTGDLWQYRPDKQKWIKLDESFALEGQATSIQPLPIEPAAIRIFETFGFLIDLNDECWLYDIESRVWQNIGQPGP